MLLFNWFVSNGYLPVWGLFLIVIAVWTLFVWAVGRFCRNKKIRSAPVVIQTQCVIWLAGFLFLFNTALVPVVLFAFHRMALVVLGGCAMAALLYFIKCGAKDKADASDPF